MSNLTFAKHTSEMRPFPRHPRVLAWLALPAYWVMTGLQLGLSKLASWCWRLRWRLGAVMAEWCPRCGKPLWSGPRISCACPLASPHRSWYRQHDSLEPYGGCNTGPGDSVQVTLLTRHELYHWARHHEFFMEGALEHLVADWKLWKKKRPLPSPLIHRK